MLTTRHTSRSYRQVVGRLPLLRPSRTGLRWSGIRAASTHSLPYDEKYDVVVVGSGAGGLTAAITAAHKGRKRVLIVEKTGFFGGTSAFSGGALWLPLNHLSSARGFQDSREQVEKYLGAFLKSKYDRTLVSAYLDSAPEMCRYLEEKQASKFVPLPAPDYYANLYGAAKAGRTVLSAPYDGRKLGQLVKQIRYPLQGYCAFGSMQVDAMDQALWSRPLASWRAFSHVCSSLLRYAADYTRYGKGSYLCNGNALVGRLLQAAVDSKVTLWRNSPAIDLIVENSRVTGLLIAKYGQKLKIKASDGVILASGGFARSSEMIRQYLDTPGSTAAPRGNQGDGIRMATNLGASLTPLALEDRALYTPISQYRPKKGPVRTYPHLMDIAKPGAVLVAEDGKRFANESAPYQDLGQAMLAAKARKAYIIADKRHLRRYGMGFALPAPYPYRHYIRDGYLFTAPTIHALSVKLEIDTAALVATIDQFNNFARTGRDLDFRRGESSYDSRHGDPEFKPNPCLAPLENGPFYAVSVHLGTSTTMQGLATDRDARVLNVTGRPIKGLYAIGADSSHFLKGKYPSGGLTLGPAMVFGFRAGVHLAETSD